jgi:hypothetical protein
LLIVRSLSNKHPGIIINTVDNKKKYQFIGEAFVDDTGLGSNTSKEDVEHHPEAESQLLITRLQQLAQEWERLLFSTGGGVKSSEMFLVHNVMALGQGQRKITYHTYSSR